MADNDKYDDEYHLVDVDAVHPEPMDPNQTVSDGAPAFGEKSDADKARINMIRKSVIAVAGVILVIILYPLISAMFSSKKDDSTITPAATVNAPAAPIAPIAPEPIVETPPAPTPTVSQDDKMSERLSALESNQDSIRAELSATSSQLTGMNENMSNLMAKIAELNNTIVLYTAKIDAQAQDIEKLHTRTIRMKTTHAPRSISRKMFVPRVRYSIQAVIPGRAWLIATNGATLTVREGTMIAGLGMVTLIDPRQGRVVTSSGQVIRFSQEDS